ncbi:uncharacterized protein A4U43_C06F3340 [Asparagus officinalis]|uniref:KIB1-4 beta-propeller domain-containing protein n=1 Tax=Asparagus officinalis TaxID=4686 RepID=A0A5P1EMJ1_ASPOF|nr:uncharacterized protein A4U43_C06F3340 [Asparagus officinalis]
MEEEQNLQLYSKKHPRDDFSSYPPQSQTAPWFVLFPRVRGDKFQTFFSLSSKEYFVKSISQLRRNRAWPTPQGWIVLLDTHSKECCLLNPISLHEVNLPPLKHKIPSLSTRFAISSSPNGPNCIFLCNDQDALLFCRPKDNQWTRHKHDLYHDIREDDFLRDVTSFNGGFSC